MENLCGVCVCVCVSLFTSDSSDRFREGIYVFEYPLSVPAVLHIQKLISSLSRSQESAAVMITCFIDEEPKA